MISNKVFMDTRSLFLRQQQPWWNGWEICNVIEIKNNEMLQSLLVERKYKTVLVKEEFLQKKIQKKEDVFVDFTTNSLTER